MADLIGRPRAARPRWLIWAATAAGALASLAVGAAALGWLAREGAARAGAEAVDPRPAALAADALRRPLDGPGAERLAADLADGALIGSDPAAAAFAPAAAQLLQSPDDAARAALLAAADPATGAAGLEALAGLAEAESGAVAADLWRARGALLAAEDPDAAIAALERALRHHPQDIATWRLVAWAHLQRDRASPALAATRVAEGLELAAAARLEEAEGRWAEALPHLKGRAARAFVLGQLGDAAVSRRDFAAAERNYSEALALSTRARDVAAISVDASRLARVQLAQSRAGSACLTLERATGAGAMVTPEEMAAACPKPPSLRGLSPPPAAPR